MSECDGSICRDVFTDDIDISASLRACLYYEKKENISEEVFSWIIHKCPSSRKCHWSVITNRMINGFVLFFLLVTVSVMASKRLLVELYYDVVSPFSYLAFEALCRYRQPWNMDLKLKPFVLGAVMRETGNAPPAMVRKMCVFYVYSMIFHGFLDIRRIFWRLAKSMIT